MAVTQGLPFTTIALKEDGRWRFEWSGAADAVFGVYLNGVLIETAIGPSYVFPFTPLASDPPAIEVVASTNTPFSAEYKPYVILQWLAVANAVAYYVEVDNGSGWQQEAVVKEDASTYVHTYVSRVFADGDSPSFRVSAVNSVESTSTSGSVELAIVTLPTIEPFDGTISIDYTSPNIVIDEVP